MTGEFRILIVDDEPKMCRALKRVLERAGVRREMGGTVGIESASTAEAAELLLKDSTFNVLITDLRLPGMDGIGLLRLVKERYPDTDVVIMTAYATVETAVEALRLGAFDYLIKPFNMDEMRHVLRAVEERQRLLSENVRLRAELEKDWKTFELIGSAPSFKRVLEMAARVAPTDSTVLLLGDSGTGKDLLAREIHRISPRREGPFIKATCSAIPEGLLESDLFGHEKGAFTGATETKSGRFELADGGTIFLDEIGDMTLSTQVKLLRVIEERAFERVGSTLTRNVDVRIIAATNRNLEEAIHTGSFREDLYYRLNVVAIRTPPLRERREDVLPLIKHFLAKWTRAHGPPEKRIDPRAMDILLSHSWPGNVRELENAIEHACVMTEGDRIEVSNLPSELRGGIERSVDAAAGAAEPEEALSEKGPGDIEAGDSESLKQVFSSLAEEGLSLDEIERRMILLALARSGGNQSRAARLLGVTRRTLGYRCDKHGIKNQGV